MIARVLVLAVLAVGAARTSSAQDVLTLDSAVGEALAQNTSLRAARAGARQADAQADSAKAPFFPRVSFGESWQRSDQPVFAFGALLSARRFTAANFAIDGLNHPPATNLFHASASVEQVLFDGGRTRAATRSAALQVDVAALDVAQAEHDVTLAVTEAYGRVLTSQSLARAAQGAVEAARQDLARGENRRDAGTATDADVLSLAVHLADMEQRAIEADGHNAVARAELNRLCGAPLDRAFTVAEPPPAAPPSIDFEALASEAEAANPQLRRAQAARDLAAQSARQARAAWLPTFAAQAGLQGDGLSFADRSSAWAVGATAQWTLSTSGAEAAGQRAAAEAQIRADADLDAARSAVRLDLLKALRDLESARARGALAQASLTQARESARIIRDRFDAGLAGVTDVTRAASALLDAETRRVGAAVDAMVASAALQRAVGRRTP